MFKNDLKENKFEDFAKTKIGEELFEKIKRVNSLLKLNINTGNESLGMLSLSSQKPISYIQDKNGKSKKVIMLGSNSYLNLTTHPLVCSASKSAIDDFGFGMGSVSNYAGITKLHKELEARIAQLYNTQDAVVFPSGYGANVGIISAICSENDVIINDSANHASIFDGCRLSGAEIKIYPHRDMRFLERILSRLDGAKKGRLLITDGVFSMDGDIAPLDKIVELKQKYGFKIMVDDAHGLGVVGASGKGSAEYFGVQKEIDLNVGMLSKGAGGLGGYCATTSDIVQYLRLYARTYFFSTALPAPLASGLNEVFKLLNEDKAGREELILKTNYLKDKLRSFGYDIGNSQSAIVPVMIYNENKLFKICNELREEGVYVNIVTYPAVRRKECRLRLCVMKDLSFENIDEAIEILNKVCFKYEIIQSKSF